ncbi:hypothetical protein G9464_19780 [Halostella sp. JP-L12]|uniref:HalOD1 output domain-containing protein n=1 Tax=Halostella TaxID=1843185 RepID=UPI0013CE41C6|nr:MULTISPECIES: HalOD1 output domain-containing protein [Halostella]NHN49814.1 hypothetical protein [Halostella sp. JP-L12]
MTSNINCDTTSVSDRSPDRIETAARAGGRREDLSTTIIMEVAEALDTDPVNLTPSLYDHIDPDALDALFDSAGDGSDVYLTIREWGCTVTVFADGRVLVDVED